LRQSLHLAHPWATFGGVKTHVLERTQLVPYPLETTFAFFSDPRNLEHLTPAFLKFEFLREPPATMVAGTVLDYRIRLYGVPVQWRTRIELVEPPTRFVDVQEKGPYANWRHTHTFRSIGAQTEMTDHVDYAIPFGPLGELARVVLVDRSLREIFDYRQRELIGVMKAVVPA
jgi:ligand-binding SRPBCC domain-containing protein